MLWMGFGWYRVTRPRQAVMSEPSQDPCAGHAQAVMRSLELFQSAWLRSQSAYQSFLQAAQDYDWDLAGEYQMKASANMESAMDAYLNGCRAQAAAQREVGKGA